MFIRITRWEWRRLAEILVQGRIPENYARWGKDLANRIELALEKDSRDKVLRERSKRSTLKGEACEVNRASSRYLGDSEETDSV